MTLRKPVALYIVYKPAGLVDLPSLLVMSRLPVVDGVQVLLLVLDVIVKHPLAVQEIECSIHSDYHKDCNWLVDVAIEKNMLYCMALFMLCQFPRPVRKLEYVFACNQCQTRLVSSLYNSCLSGRFALGIGLSFVRYCLSIASLWGYARCYVHVVLCVKCKDVTVFSTTVKVCQSEEGCYWVLLPLNIVTCRVLFCMAWFAWIHRRWIVHGWM